MPRSLVLGVAIVAATASALAVIVVSSWDRGGGTAVTPVRSARGIEARAKLEPQVVLFGDTVHAIVDVILDPDRVDPESVRVSAVFSPWEVVQQPLRTRQDADTATHIRVDYALRCLTSACSLSGQVASLEFDPARVGFESSGGSDGERGTMAVPWPRFAVYSRSTSSIADARGSAIPWRADLLTPPAVSYRAAPALLLVLLLGGCVLFGAGGIALGYLAWPRREPLPAPEPKLPPEPELSPLERALALLEDASVPQDGVADRRRALELVAEELEFSEADLAESARVLAWSEADPEIEQTRELAALVRSALPPPDEERDDDAE